MKSEFHLKKNQRPSRILHGSPKKTSVQQLWARLCKIIWSQMILSCCSNVSVLHSLIAEQKSICSFIFFTYYLKVL